MARLVDQATTRLVWCTSIASISAPTTTELNAGTDLTANMVTSYDVGADASDKISEQAVADTAKTEAPTLQNYHGTLVLFRQYTAGAPSGGDALATFAGNYEAGYFVRRTGKSSTSAWATSDKVEVYQFVADVPQLQGGTASGYVKATVPMLAQGNFKVAATVA